MRKIFLLKTLFFKNYFKNKEFKKKIKTILSIFQGKINIQKIKVLFILKNNKKDFSHSTILMKTIILKAFSKEKMKAFNFLKKQTKLKINEFFEIFTILMKIFNKRNFQTFKIISNEKSNEKINEKTVKLMNFIHFFTKVCNLQKKEAFNKFKISKPDLKIFFFT